MFEIWEGRGFCRLLNCLLINDRDACANLPNLVSLLAKDKIKLSVRQRVTTP
jgi:hypothetical protein